MEKALQVLLVQHLEMVVQELIHFQLTQVVLAVTLLVVVAEDNIILEIAQLVALVAEVTVAMVMEMLVVQAQSQQLLPLLMQPLILLVKYLVLMYTSLVVAEVVHTNLIVVEQEVLVDWAAEAKVVNME